MSREITGILVDGSNQPLVDAKLSFIAIKPRSGTPSVALGTTVSCMTAINGAYSITLEVCRYRVALTPNKKTRLVLGEIQVDTNPPIDVQTLLNSEQ